MSKHDAESTRPRRASWLVGGTILATIVVTLTLFADERFWELAANTLIVSGGAALIAVLLGGVLAFLLVRADTPCRQFMLAAIGASLFIPVYLQATGWDAGFGRLGWFVTGSAPVARPLLDGYAACIFIHGVAGIPWAALIVGVGASRIEAEVEEDALLSTSAWRVFLLVTLPRSAASIAAAAIFVSLMACGEMTVTDMYQVFTFAEVLYVDGPTAESLAEAGISTAASIAMLAGLSLAALFATASLAPREHGYTPHRPLLFRLGIWRLPAAIVAASIVLFIVAAPLFNLAYKAGFEFVGEDGALASTWSAVKFASIVCDAPYRYRTEFGWSLMIAAAAATVAVVVSLPLAWLARGGRWKAAPAFALAALCLALPGPLVGMAVIFLFTRLTTTPLEWLNQPMAFLYDRTIAGPVTAAAVRSLPAALLVLWHVLRSLPRDTFEAASVEGAGKAATFFRVALPQAALAVVAAWFAAAAVAMGDVAATILVVPPGVDTVPRRVFGLVHAGVDDQVAGLSLAAFGGFLIISGIVMLVMRFGRPSN